ncbi:hypothetical protein [Amorphus sp. MBR-141]
MDPEGDPLGHYLRSLRLLEAHVPEDTLVLPGHQLPFYGLAERWLPADRQSPRGPVPDDRRCLCGGAEIGAELVPVVFHRSLDPHQMSFAFSETHAHVNRMIRRGELAWIERDGNFACALAG